MANLKDLTINDTGFIKLPSGTADQRPSPSTGMMRWNISRNEFEIANNANWISAQNKKPQIVTNGLVLNLDAGDPQSYKGSGTVWTDLSGNGNNGTLTNGPTYNSGNGGSIVFDGVDDYAKNDTPNLPTGNVTATICAWVYVLTIVNSWQGFVGWGNTSTGQSALLDMNNGNLAFSTWGGLGSQDLISSYTVPLNAWKYVVGSISNMNINLYVDGINVLSSQISSTPNVTSTNLRIATTDYPGRYLNTRISSCKIYNRALSATEIQQNFNATRGRFGI
jgi:Concanavalin A-like lectin/glucanases superfamily